MSARPVARPPARPRGCPRLRDRARGRGGDRARVRASARSRSRSHARAFSFIELMLALAVAAILAAVAVPAFFEQLARARRTEVQAALLEDAGYMQHYYASHDAFSGTPPPQLPFARTPRAGGASYTIVVRVPADDPSSFVLTATRAGAMASDPCGDLTYDHLGQRGQVAGSAAAGRDAARCWH